jgi:hypothetical protein
MDIFDKRLLIEMAMMVLIVMAVGFAYLLIRRQFNDLQRLLGGTVTPLWKAALEAAQEILTHPHPFAAEADELMKEAATELETHVPMDRSKSARLEELLFQRIASKDPEIRPGEAEAAAAYPFLRRLALKESTGDVSTDIRLTGQTVSDGENKTND